MRAGTAIPAGSAERALESLYRQREEAWPFLAEELASDKTRDLEDAGVSKSGTPGEAEKERESLEQVQAATIRPKDTVEESSPTERNCDQQEQQPPPSHMGHGKDDKKKASVGTSGEAVCESFLLTRVSVALETFARSRADQGYPLGDFHVRDLKDFLYLGGQAKARRRDLSPCCVRHLNSQPPLL